MKNLDDYINSLKPNAEVIKNLIAKTNNKTITSSEYKDLQKRLLWQYSIQEILLRFELLPCGDETYNNYPTCKYHLDGDKILFISDTHFGQDKENLSLFDETIEFASNHGIKTIIHAGDFFEGMSRNFKEMRKLSYEERYDYFQEEIKRAKSFLPQDINTHLLLGNHDFSILQACPKLVNSFFDQNNLFILGLGRGVINWNNLTPIVISHPIDTISFKKQPLNAITIQGHSHVYYVDSTHKTIYLPSLSDDSREPVVDLSDWGITFKENSNRPKPLFVLAEITSDESILFREYEVISKEKPKIADEIEYDLKNQKMSRIRNKYY